MIFSAGPGTPLLLRRFLGFLAVDFIDKNVFDNRVTFHDYTQQIFRKFIFIFGDELINVILYMLRGMLDPENISLKPFLKEKFIFGVSLNNLIQKIFAVLILLAFPG